MSEQLAPPREIAPPTNPAPPERRGGVAPPRDDPPRKPPNDPASGLHVRLLVEHDWVLLLDPAGKRVAEVRVPAAGTQAVESVPVSAFDPIGAEVGILSMKLLRQSSTSAQKTQNRLAFSFTAMNWMLLATFTVGIVGFALAMWRGFQADDAVELAATGIFGGLSAAAFATAFIARTTDGVADAGPRAAWIQSIVTTYWSKLAYFSDPRSAAADLQAAQDAFNESITKFLEVTRRQRQSPPTITRA